MVEERLSILTEGDLEGDWTSEGELREYRFVIFDKVNKTLAFLFYKFS